jgi:hypothetical protein
MVSVRTMNWSAHLFSKLLINLSIAIGRAVGNTLNGIIIGTFLCFILSGIGITIGVMTDQLLKYTQIIQSPGPGLGMFLVFLVLSLLSILYMFLARFLANEDGDHDLADNSFDLLFIGYGMFITLLILQIYYYCKYDPSIFAENNVSFWDIVKYGFGLTLLGFIPDVLQYTPIELNLSPVGGMRLVQFLVKILMAVTVVSGTFRYIEARYHMKLLPF